MSISRDEFDPLAVVVDWLDACRLGELNVLLDLYDERAALECDCERVSLTGRKSIAGHQSWRAQLSTAFTLDDIALTGDGVQVDYQKLRRQADPNSFSVHRLRQDTPHKLRPIG